MKISEFRWFVVKTIRTISRELLQNVILGANEKSLSQKIQLSFVQVRNENFSLVTVNTLTKIKKSFVALAFLYLCIRAYTVYTDHRALLWPINLKDHRRVARWLYALQANNATINHRQGLIIKTQTLYHVYYNRYKKLESTIFNEWLKSIEFLSLLLIYLQKV